MTQGAGNSGMRRCDQMRYALLLLLGVGCAPKTASAIIELPDAATFDMNAGADMRELPRDMAAPPPVDDMHRADFTIYVDLAYSDLSDPIDLAPSPDLMMPMCLMLGAPCASGDTCCSGQGGCGFTGVGPPKMPGGPYDNCCVGVGVACTTKADCCYPNTCKLITGTMKCNP